MLRKLIVFLTTVVVLAATHASALGLGDITLESALNQPLSARIELLQTEGVRMEDIRVQMATADDFERFSLDRPFYLDSILFRIRETGDGPYIELSSTSPIREPYLSFVLDTRWPNGRVLTEYTVLLDPPSFANQGAIQAPQPPVSTRFEAVAESESPEPETAAPQPAVPAEQVQAGTVSSDADETTDADGQQPDDRQQRFASTDTDTVSTVEVGGDDTLWDIALEVRPDDSVSVQQTMLALQRLNPDAFINGNINLVRRGAVLRVPDADSVHQTGSGDAISEVGRQNQMFEDRRDAPLGSEPLAPPPSNDTGTTSGDGELSVVSVDDESADESSPTDADAAAGEALQNRIETLENRLAVSREEVDRIERENEELTGRLAMLEEQIESAREIIRLRDLELAQLQDSLSTAEAPQQGDSSTQTAPTPTVTMAPEAPLPRRILDIVLANPMALGAILALVVALLVLLLIRRNKAKQTEFADEQHEQDDEDELDFSGVGASAASGVEVDVEDDMDDEHDAGDHDEEDMDSELSRPYEEHEDDDELVDELRNFGEQDEQELVSDELDDLLAEVDALIEHRQYDEARMLLEDAIVADPNRQELRVRLLEVLVEDGDVEAFRLQESELGPVEPALEGRVRALRERVAALESDGEPEHREADSDKDEGFSDFSDLPEEDDLELELDMESSAEVDDQKVEQGGGSTGEPDGQDELDGLEAGAEEDIFDFDLDLDEDKPLEDVDATLHKPDDSGEVAAYAGTLSDEHESDRESPAQRPEETRTEAGEEFEFDFDLELDDEGDRPVAETTGQDSEERPEVRSADETSDRSDEEFEFSLDDFALDTETETETAPDTEKVDAPGPTTSGGQDDQEAADPFADLSFTDSDAEQEMTDLPADSDDDFEFLSGTDEAATKLDLARAYIDMGDGEGAREILEEVIEEGTEAQANDARQLIERLS